MATVQTTRPTTTVATRTVSTTPTTARAVAAPVYTQQTKGVLQLADKNPLVKSWQDFLIAIGYVDIPVGIISGLFDHATEIATRDFQQKNQFAVTGKADWATVSLAITQARNWAVTEAQRAILLAAANALTALRPVAVSRPTVTARPIARSTASVATSRATSAAVSSANMAAVDAANKRAAAAEAAAKAAQAAAAAAATKTAAAEATAQALKAEAAKAAAAATSAATTAVQEAQKVETLSAQTGAPIAKDEQGLFVDPLPPEGDGEAVPFWKTTPYLIGVGVVLAGAAYWYFSKKGSKKHK